MVLVWRGPIHEPAWGWCGGRVNGPGWLGGRELLSVTSSWFCVFLLLRSPSCDTHMGLNTYCVRILDCFTQWAKRRTKFKAQVPDARMNLTCKVLVNSPCSCVSDLRNSFSNHGASSTKISQLSKINHCNSNLFPCSVLVVESGVISVTVQKSMKSIICTELWSFKQKSASLKASNIWLVLPIHQRHSTNLCKSFSCSLYLFMAYCSTRNHFFMGRRWHLSLRFVPWTVLEQVSSNSYRTDGWGTKHVKLAFTFFFLSD